MSKNLGQNFSQNFSQNSVENFQNFPAQKFQKISSKSPTKSPTKTTSQISENSLHKAQRFRTLAACALGFCLEMMDIMLIAYALRAVMAEFALSSAAGGLISTATNFAMLAGGLVFGAFAARLGYVRSFALSIYLFALATAAIFFAPNFAVLLALRALAGIGAGAEYGLSMALLAANFPPAKLGQISAIVGVFGQLGAALAALAAGILLEDFGWRALFLVGLIPLFLAIWVQFSLAEPSIKSARKINLKTALAGRGLITCALLFMCCVQIGGYFGLMNWLPTIAAQSLNLGAVGKSSYWMLATIAGMCAGMLLFGRLFDRLGARVAFAVFLLGSAASVIAFSIVQNYSQLLAAGFVVGFFSNGMFAGYGALISKIYPQNFCAIANNFIIGTGRAVGGLSPLAIGAAMDLGASVALIMSAIAAAYCCSFIINLLLIKEKS